MVRCIRGMSDQQVGVMDLPNDLIGVGVSGGR